MEIAIGNILKNKITGELFRVNNIKLSTIYWVAKDLPNKIWLGDEEMLEVFYEKIDNVRAIKS